MQPFVNPFSTSLSLSATNPYANLVYSMPQASTYLLNEILSRQLASHSTPPKSLFSGPSSGSAEEEETEEGGDEEEEELVVVEDPVINSKSPPAGQREDKVESRDAPSAGLSLLHAVHEVANAKKLAYQVDCSIIPPSFRMNSHTETR